MVQIFQMSSYSFNNGSSTHWMRSWRESFKLTLRNGARLLTRISFDKALASLLDSSLVQIDEEGVSLKSHRLVRLVVAESMSPSTKSSVFNRIVFQLNAAFPSQFDGRPLHDQWHIGERLAPQVAGLLESYLIYKDDIDEPILLCEIIARCSW